MEATIAIPHFRSAEPPRLNMKPLLIVVVFAAILLCAHAITRHGEEAQAVRQCLENKAPVAHLFNPATGRHYFVCQMEDEEGKPVFGIQVRVKDGWRWREVTALIKNKMHTLEQVIKYLNNGGAF